MEGLNRLHSLPDEVKSRIVEKYGSLEDLYKKIWNLDATLYSLAGNTAAAQEKAVIETQLYKIDDELEELGAEDIVTDVRADFGDVIVEKNISALNEHLAQYGTDFPTMQQWLKDNYGV
jgi:hypothetical protein